MTDTAFPSLFTPVKLGALELSNRVVMAPMTRGRADPDDIPGPLIREYYRQRATAGLIVTEGVQPSQTGKGYWRTPGIHSQAQIEGWTAVADAVHKEGGRIIMQLMHCGRAVIPDNRGFEAEVVAPSAIASPDKIPGPDGVPVLPPVPRALEKHEIAGIVEEHAEAARNARAAGIDGIELHCASGYLVNQFLNPASNARTDEYGGSPENRMRFPLEVLSAMADAIGGDRVGFRIAPGNPYNGMDASDPDATFGPFIEAADKLGLAFLHMIDMSHDDYDARALLKGRWHGNVILNNNLDGENAESLLSSGDADAVSFGRSFVSNPDLVARLKTGRPLAPVDRSTLYTGEERGFTDYPCFAEGD